MSASPKPVSTRTRPLSVSSSSTWQTISGVRGGRMVPQLRWWTFTTHAPFVPIRLWPSVNRRSSRSGGVTDPGVGDPATGDDPQVEPVSVDAVHVAAAVSGKPPSAFAIAPRSSAWSSLRCAIAPAHAATPDRVAPRHRPRRSPSPSGRTRRPSAPAAPAAPTARSRCSRCSTWPRRPRHRCASRAAASSSPVGSFDHAARVTRPLASGSDVGARRDDRQARPPVVREIAAVLGQAATRTAPAHRRAGRR